MPSWKKVVTSGSSAHLNHVTASGNISGSSTSTGSFGKATIGGPVFNDVSSSRHSGLTVHSPSGANATGSAITIVGDSFQGRQRINWDMEGLDGKVYSYIEARGQGGGRNRGELYFATRNGGRDAFEAVPRLGINQAGRVSIMGTFGQTESQVAGGNMTFNSASLNVFTGNTFDNAPYAGWFENRVDATGKGGIYISTVTGRDTNAIIRAAKRTLAGAETKVFEVLANGQISGSSTSTGSFGLLQVDGGQESGVVIGPLNTGNADDRKLTIVGYDEPMIEFETHGGWGRQRIQGNFGGTLKMWNSGSTAKKLSLHIGHDTERQGHVRFMHSEYDAIAIGLNGSYPIAYFGAESGSNNYTGNAVISSRSSTSVVNHLHFTKNNVLSGSATSTGSFGQLKAGKISVLDESRFDSAYLPDLQFYEEAIYTATLTPQGSGTITVGGGGSPEFNKLGFTRIGNKVHVHGNINVSAVSSPTGTNIALNLPYQTRANSSSVVGTMRQTGMVLFYDTSNWFDMPIFIDENDSTVLLLVDAYRTLGGDAPPNVNTVAASWQFRIDFHYFIGRFD